MGLIEDIQDAIVRGQYKQALVAQGEIISRKVSKGLIAREIDFALKIAQEGGIKLNLPSCFSSLSVYGQRDEILRAIEKL